MDTFKFPPAAPAQLRETAREHVSSSVRESNALRASVLDAALELGIVGNAGWLDSLGEEEFEETSSPGLTSGSTVTSESAGTHTDPYESQSFHASPPRPDTSDISPAPATLASAVVSPFQFMTGAKLDRNVEFAAVKQPNGKSNKLRKLRKDGGGYESDAGYISEGVTKKDKKSKKKAVVEPVDSDAEGASRKDSQSTVASTRTRKDSEKLPARTRKDSEKSSKSDKVAEKAEKKAAKARKSGKKGEKSGYETGGYETDAPEVPRVPVPLRSDSLADTLGASLNKPAPMNFLGTGADFLSSPPPTATRGNATDYETDGDGHPSGSVKKPKKSKFMRKKKEDATHTDYETDGDEGKSSSKGPKKSRSFFRMGKSKDEDFVVPPLPPMPPAVLTPPVLPIAQMFSSNSRNTTPVPVTSPKSTKHFRSPLPESFGASSSASIISSLEETPITYLPALMSEGPSTPLNVRTYSPMPIANGNASYGSPAQYSPTGHNSAARTQQLLASTTDVLNRRVGRSQLGRGNNPQYTQTVTPSSPEYTRPLHIVPRSPGPHQATSWQNQTTDDTEVESSAGHGSSEAYGSSVGHGSSEDSHQRGHNPSRSMASTGTHVSYSAESMGYSIHQDPYYPTVEAHDKMPENAGAHVRYMSDQTSHFTHDTHSSENTSSNASSGGHMSSATSTSEGSGRPRERPRPVAHDSTATFTSMSSGSSHGEKAATPIPTSMTRAASPNRSSPFMRRTPTVLAIPPGSFTAPLSPGLPTGPAMSRRPSLLSIVPSDEWIVPSPMASPGRSVLAHYDIPPPSPPPMGPLPARPTNQQQVSSSLSRAPSPSFRAPSPSFRAPSPSFHGPHASETMKQDPPNPAGHVPRSSHSPIAFGTRAPPRGTPTPVPNSAPVVQQQQLPRVRGRESPFPSRPIASRPPPASAGVQASSAGAGSFEARVQVRRYRDLYVLQTDAPVAGDEAANDPPGQRQQQQRTKPWSADPLGPRPRGLPGIQVEHASDDESDYGAVIDRMSSRSPEPRGRISYDEEPKDLDEILQGSFDDSGERFADSRYLEEYDEERSMYSEDGVSRYLPDISDDESDILGGNNRESKFSRFSATSQATVLDTQMSEEARLRFVQRVEAMSSNGVQNGGGGRRVLEQASVRDIEREGARDAGMMRGNIPPVPKFSPAPHIRFGGRF